MKQVIKIIKDTIAKCKQNGDMFHMPSLMRDDVKVTENELKPKGASLYRTEYQIDFSNGDWIHVETASKDMCRSYQVNPDRSVVEVKSSDSSLSFTDAWDEKY